MKPLESIRARMAKRKTLRPPESPESAVAEMPDKGEESVQEEIRIELHPTKEKAEPRRTPTMNLQVTKCEAAPDSITVFFSGDVNQSPAPGSTSALTPANYTVYSPPRFMQPTAVSSIPGSSITAFGTSAVKISLGSATLGRGAFVMVTAANIRSLSGNEDLDPTHATAVTEVNGKSALRIVDCAASPNHLTVSFSEPLDTSQLGTNAGSDPNAVANYAVMKLPSSGTSGTAITVKGATYDVFNRATFLELNANQLQKGQWVLVTVNNVASETGPIANGGNNTFSSQVNGGGGTQPGPKTKKEIKEITNSVEDAVAFPLLTEQVSFPAGMPAAANAAVVSGGGRNGSSLGQIATNAINDVLGWKTNATDPKGFIGALTQSFSLQEFEGHTEATWVPRTYAVQTDIGGGITGAQASLYTRAKDALDKALPLLDGLYPLDPDADPEFVKALREMAKSQMIEIVKQLGAVGGPSILRVNTYFGILLGQNNIVFDPPTVPEFDPDKVQGTLGEIRDTYGIFFLNNPFSNSVEDEGDITNFRVISDYMTSLLQSWISNGQFFQLGSTQPNFFGTQLVLLSRQFSVVAESVNEVRFTLDSVFIGPSERQTLLLQFKTFPAMFLEDVLREVEDFSTGEGPRLLQDSGRISVNNNVIPVLQSLTGLVREARKPLNIKSLPDGYRTVRVQRSLEDLNDQLDELINLAIPVGQEVPPSPTEPEQPFSTLNVNPNAAALSGPPVLVPVTITGTGFKRGAIVSFISTSSDTDAPIVTANVPVFLSDNFLFVQVTVTEGGPWTSTNDRIFTYTVKVRNPDSPVAASLQNGFAVTLQAVANQQVPRGSTPALA